MALAILDDCVSCDMCVGECPNQAIGKTASIYRIDPDKCTECDGVSERPRCVSICAVDCIQPSPLG